MTTPPFDPFATGLLRIDEDVAVDGVNHSHLIVRPELINASGVVHGGVTYSLVDQSMGAAADSLLNPGENSTTLEIKINYLEPVLEGRIDCESRVLRRGRRVAVIESDVHNDGRLVAKALGSYAFIRSDRPLPPAQ